MFYLIVFIFSILIITNKTEHPTTQNSNYKVQQHRQMKLSSIQQKQTNKQKQDIQHSNNQTFKTNTNSTNEKSGDRTQQTINKLKIRKNKNQQQFKIIIRNSAHRAFKNLYNSITKNSLKFKNSNI